MNKNELLKDPVQQFLVWYEEAHTQEKCDVDAMSLATTAKDGKPSVRVVLYKGVREGGVVFYTNYNSPKASELDDNPYAATVFYWPHLYRQVRISGAVTKLSYDESNQYFQTRPRESQIGAWASQQSEIITGRDDFDANFHEFDKEYHDKVIPCPLHWGGYRIEPDFIELWQGQAHRLHDRFVYKKSADGLWEIARLAP
jgi:pyridoxamine 5'-phosphate oxidase